MKSCILALGAVLGWLEGGEKIVCRIGREDFFSGSEGLFLLLQTIELLLLERKGKKGKEKNLVGGGSRYTNLGEVERKLTQADPTYGIPSAAPLG